MRRLCLVDNSVAQRIARNDHIFHAYQQLLATHSIASCLPQILEAGYSFRKRDYLSAMDRAMQGSTFLAPTPQIAEIALRMQRALNDRGQHRAVGVLDLEIAATAVHYSDADRAVEVVHYDSDFETLAAAFPQLKTRWIVTQGSVS